MANPLLDQGPISRLIHGAIEYVAAVALIVAPLLLSFESRAATAASIVAGIALLIVAATTEGPPGLVDGLPVEVHLMLDFILAVFLIAAPFVLGFSDERNPTVFFIALGVIHLLVTIATRFEPVESTASSTARQR